MAGTMATYLDAIVSDIAARRGIVNIAVSGGSVTKLLGAALKHAFEHRMNLQTEKWRVWCVVGCLAPPLPPARAHFAAADAEREGWGHA